MKRLLQGEEPYGVWRPSKYKPKAKRQKGKKAKKLSQKEQSERFIETARRLKSDESGNKFTQLIDDILPSKTKDD